MAQHRRYAEDAMPLHEFASSIGREEEMIGPEVPNTVAAAIAHAWWWWVLLLLGGIALAIAIAALVLAAGAEPKHEDHKVPDIVGWWMAANRGTYSDRPSAMEIYQPAHSKNLAARLYAGIPGQLREWTPMDYAAGAREGDFATPDIVLEQPDPTKPQWVAFWDNFPPYNLTQAFYENYFQSSVTQPDDVLWFGGIQIPDVTVSQYPIVKFVRLPGRPDIAPYADIPYVDNTNPTTMVRYLWDMLVLITEQLNVNAWPREYGGYASYAALLESLLSTGVSRTARVVDVWRSRPDIGLIFSGAVCTTLVTDVYSNPLLGERFVVSGFTSARGYDTLNGEWKQNDWPQAGGAIGDIYLPTHFVGSRFTYTTNVPTNTSSLPPYDAQIDGNATVDVYVPGIVAESGPYDLAGAATVLVKECGLSTHSWFRLWMAYIGGIGYTVVDTMAELAEMLASDSAFGGLSSGIRYSLNTVPTWVYTNAFSQYNYGAIELNDPTGLNPLGFFFYDIVANNYLDEDAIFTTYWEVIGDCNPLLPITCAMVETTGGYYLNNGNAFAYTTLPRAAGNPNASRFTAAGAVEGDFTTGMISADRSGGMPIGYVYQRAMQPFDAIWQYSAIQEFSPPGTPPSMAPFYDGLANALENLMTYDPQCMIIDNVWNGGGFFPYVYALASFFGADRSAMALFQSTADDGFSGMTAFVDIAIDGQLPALLSGATGMTFINATYAAMTYPTAVFRGAGKMVVVMQGIMAVSAGDVFPHLMRDPVGPDYGDIGEGVNSRIVGDCDGRLFGVSGGRRNLPINEANNLHESDGAPTTPFYGINIENYAALAYAHNTSAFISNQQPPTAPDVLLSSDIRDMLWIDVGASGVPYPRNPADGGTDANVLPLAAGVTDTPSPADPTTWRHRTLEAAIMQCGAWEESRRRSVDARAPRTIFYPQRSLDDVRASNAARLSSMAGTLDEHNDVLLARLRENAARDAAAHRDELLGLNPNVLEFYLDRRE